jgi:hypothetical protein
VRHVQAQRDVESLQVQDVHQKVYPDEEGVLHQVGVCAYDLHDGDHHDIGSVDEGKVLRLVLLVVQQASDCLVD